MQSAENDITAPKIVTLEDFKAVDFLQAISNITSIDCSDIESIYNKAAKDSLEQKKESDFRVFRLLCGFCSFHFNVDESSSPFGPQFVLRSGNRSPIPEDFSGEQNNILSEIISDITHPGLRARIADVVWLNNKKEQQNAAEIAINAYCESAEGLLNGSYTSRFNSTDKDYDEISDLAQRAMQIASSIHKKGQIPDMVRNTIVSVIDATIKENECIAFLNVGSLALIHGIIDAAILAQKAEELATQASNLPTPYPMAIKPVWEIAAHAHKKNKNAESERVCRLNAVNQTLDMRKQVKGASAESHWIRTAIEELRRISGTQDKREELRLEMRSLQEKAADEFGAFSTPIELEDIRENVAEMFEKLSLSDALYNFALLQKSIPIEELRKEAVKSVNASPIFAMMPSSYTDNEGKVVAEAPGASATGEHSEEWLNKACSDNYRLHRHISVGGRIDAARLTIMSNYSVSQRHFEAIVQYSPFIPASHRYIFALGFAKFLQGDFISAAHLLLPQMENSIRYVLKSNNIETSKIMSDMLQEDPSLSDMFNKWRPELENIFTAPVIYEIELLFLHRPGPALRHEFAHGKITTGQCFDTDAIYACWFIYRLCCIPLLRNWQEYISPSIGT